MNRFSIFVWMALAAGCAKRQENPAAPPSNNGPDTAGTWLTSGGRYRVKLTAAPETLKTDTTYQFKLKVMDADSLTPVTGLLPEAGFFHASMGHGGPRTPFAVELDSGYYEIDSIHADMTGAWELTLTMGPQPPDTVRFRFQAVSGPAPATYSFTIDTLLDFRSWTAVDTNIGPDPLLGTAHNVRDTVYRIVYKKPAGAMPDGNGQFSLGTIFLKELRKQVNNQPDSAAFGIITVMAKVGTTGSEYWEYADLPADMSSMNNPSVMYDMCTSCHAAATGSAGTDYIFNHPR